MVLSHFLFNKLYMEQSAFEGFFKELYPSLVNYAGRVLNDRNAGEEVVQTVFTNLWLKKDSITLTTPTIEIVGFLGQARSTLPPYVHKGIVLPSLYFSQHSSLCYV